MHGHWPAQASMQHATIMDTEPFPIWQQLLEQARFMTWAHLSRDQLQCLKGIDSDKAATAPTAASQILLQLQTVVGYGQAQQTILLDLYAHTLRQGQVCAAPTC